MSRPIIASGRQGRRASRRGVTLPRRAAPCQPPPRAATGGQRGGTSGQGPQARGEDPRLLAAVLASRRQERAGEVPVLVDLDRDADLVPLDPLGGDQRPLEGGLDHVLGLEGDPLARAPGVRVDPAVLERGVTHLARDGAVLGDRERHRQLLCLAPVDRDLGVALPASDHRRGGRDRRLPARRRACGDSHQQRDDQRVAAHGRTPPPCVAGAVRDGGLRMRLITV